MKAVTCEKCGAKFEAEDLSGLFEDNQNHYICDDCYEKVQAEGREEAKKVTEEYEAARRGEIESEI